jgi:hypothetical protein
MEPSGESLAMASAGSWMERAHRRGCLFPTESPLLRGGAGFISTSTLLLVESTLPGQGFQ